jgi:nucleoside-diphosphate-sugar epimerase
VYVEQLARMLGVPFVSVRLAVIYGLAPLTKSEAPFMTVANLFCQRAVVGEPLEVLENRELAFIHVSDAARALLAALDFPTQPVWQAVNAAAEVLSISQVAHIVQRAVHTRNRFVRIHGANDTLAAPAYTVSSRLDDVGFVVHHTMEESIPGVLDHFLQLHASSEA